MNLKQLLDEAFKAYAPDMVDSTGAYDEETGNWDGDTLALFVLREMKDILGHIEGDIPVEGITSAVQAFDRALDQLSNVRQKLALIAVQEKINGYAEKAKK